MTRISIALLMVIGASCASDTSPSSIQQTLNQDDGEPCDPPGDPLLMDVGGGVALSSYAAGVLFDADATGTRIKLAWPTAGAWLALDVNHNGIIDSGAELFGSASKTTGGFASLRAYDINGDGFIDSNDPVFAKLLLWGDHNRDGVSQPAELSTLVDNRISFIDLEHVGPTTTDGSGNVFLSSSQAEGRRLHSVVPVRSGSGTVATQAVCSGGGGGGGGTPTPKWVCRTYCGGTLGDAWEYDGTYSYAICGPPASGYPYGSNPVRVSTFQATRSNVVQQTSAAASLEACQTTRKNYVFDGALVYQPTVNGFAECVPSGEQHPLLTPTPDVPLTACYQTN